jgi:DNA polymerase-1
MSKNLLLIDGYAFMFRAYHSMPPLVRKDGLNVGAIYGFTAMLLKIVENFEYTHIAVALDHGAPSLRKEIYSEYKAHRPKAPEDLILQFPLLRTLLSALNIAFLEKEGFEADDFIAHYTKEASNNDINVTIISSDKDLMQLIKDDTIKMYDPMKERIINEQAVIDKFGVPPSQIRDLLAIVGDSSDNIPGIPGVGPKTAAELLLKFNDLDGIYNNISEITQPKRRTSFVENKDLVFLSRILVTLIDDIKDQVDVSKFEKQVNFGENFIKFLEEQNFLSLIRRYSKLLPESAKQAITIFDNVKYTEITTEDEFSKLYDKSYECGIISLNVIYNNDLNLIEKIYFGFEKESYLLILNSQTQDTLFAQEKYINYKPTLNKILADNSILKIIPNIKLFFKFFDNVNAFDDLELINYCLNAGKKQSELSYMLFELFALSPLDTKDAEQKNQLNYSLAVAYVYAFKKLKSLLTENKLLEIYETIEKPLIHVLNNMEKNGIEVSQKVLKELYDKFSGKITDLEQKIYSIAGETFNVASPKQLSEILFEKLNYTLGKKNSKKTTNQETLEELSNAGYVIADYLLEWRHYSKLKGTYTTSLEKFIANDKRVHSTFLMTQTSTGRLSSVNPNLQNIPIRTEEGKSIRSAFFAKSGFVLVSLDYSQIELRLLAHVANVKALKDAFNKNLDIHSITAAKILNIPEAQVDAEARRKAKAINFGILYGMSSFSLAKRLGIPKTVADKYIESYFAEFSEIKEYLATTIEYAKKHGYVETIYGRRCHVPLINSASYLERSFAERAAINAPLQGSQADIIKLAMNKLWQKYLPQSDVIKLVLQIHDELIFEVEENLVENFVRDATNQMSEIVKLSIPLKVNSAIGKKWSELN